MHLAQEEKLEIKSGRSKSTKRNLRRKRCRLVKEQEFSTSRVMKESKNKAGFKYNSCLVRRLGFYKNSTKEKFSHAAVSKRLSLTDKLNNIRDSIINTEVGVNFEETRQIFESSRFSNLLTSFLVRISKVPFVALLDAHCPANAPEYTSYSQIQSFIRSILHKTQFYSLYGHKSRKSLDRNVRLYLNSPRLMEMPLGLFLTKFDLTEVSWLADYPRNVAQNAVAKLLKWTLVDFVEALVRGFFKITDVSRRNCKRKLFFYRKCVWSQLISVGMKKLKKNNYIEISAEVFKKLNSANNKFQPSITELRFVPKTNKFDVRPITRPHKTSITRRQLDTEDCQRKQKTLEQIASAFPIKSDLSGKTLHQQWTNFLHGIHESDRIYYVVADIVNAFGSINLSKLKSIMRKYSPMSDQDQVLASITENLFLQVVRFNQDGRTTRFLVKHGVLQGEPLSSLFSDIYYGYITMQYFAPFLSDKKGVLLRGADDFLYLTVSKEMARNFIKVINAGIPDFNCFFNKDKTQTNIDKTIDNQESQYDGNQKNLNNFSYCGSIVDVQSRSISPNMASYNDANVGYAQSWPTLSRPIKRWITKKFSTLCQMKLSAVYFNTTNSRHTCLSTLACNVYIALRRLTVMLDVLLKSRGLPFKEDWLWKCVMLGFRKFSRVSFKCPVSQDEVIYICLKSLVQECKCQLYPRSLQRGAKRALSKCRLSSHSSAANKVTAELDQIVRGVQTRIPNVRATAKWS